MRKIHLKEVLEIELYKFNMNYKRNSEKFTPVHPRHQCREYTNVDEKKT